MLPKVKILLISVLLFISVLDVFSQGCSDAGFCTMGAMQPDQHYSKKVQLKLRSISFGQYIGLTRFDDQILAYTLDFSLAVGEKSNIQGKVPYSFTYGPLANTRGMGDISLSFSRNLLRKYSYQLDVTAGAKIPTGDGNGNISADGRPLPMYYQQSLGTYDLVLGASLISRKWLVATGLQHPFNSIDNQFLWGRWEGSEFEQLALEYPRGNGLRRGTDVMLRIERNFRFSRLNLNLGLLPIYRLNEDIITTPAGESIAIEGSDGLALSLLTGLTYNFNVRSGIKVINGFRLVKRKVNPDGLSREFVNSITYVYRF